MVFFSYKNVKNNKKLTKIGKKCKFWSEITFQYFLKNNIWSENTFKSSSRKYSIVFIYIHILYFYGVFLPLKNK